MSAEPDSPTDFIIMTTEELLGLLQMVASGEDPMTVMLMVVLESQLYDNEDHATEE
jgi:hypothetical protein